MYEGYPYHCKLGLDQSPILVLSISRPNVVLRGERSHLFIAFMLYLQSVNELSRTYQCNLYRNKWLAPATIWPSLLMIVLAQNI